MANHDTGTVLRIIFQWLYTRHNQLIHGGMTWGSSVNRDQLRDANHIMSDVVPVIIEIQLDNAQRHWGDSRLSGAPTSALCRQSPTSIS